MHELSLATGVIELCQHEAESHRYSHIREVEIEIGALSGVDADAFQSALELITKDTILEKSEFQIHRIKGTGFCPNGHPQFEMSFRMEICPVCGNYPSKVIGGSEFRVVSILVD